MNTSQPDTELDSESSIEEAAAKLAAMESQEDEPEESEEPQASEEAEPAVEGEEVEEPAPKARVKVGEEELDLDEVVAGYMKDKDYRQKTAKVAEQLREVESVRERILTKLATQANQADAVLAAMHQSLLGDQQDFAPLLQSDPHQYLLRKAAFDEKVAVYQRGLNERQALQQRQQDEADAHRQTIIQKEGELLLAALPTWKDPAKAAAERQEIGQFLLSTGYTPQDLEELTDHRAVLLARDAMLYRKQKSAVPVKPKAVAPPAVKPGASGQSPAASDHEKALMARVRRYGSMDDAAELLKIRSSR